MPLPLRPQCSVTLTGLLPASNEAIICCLLYLQRSNKGEGGGSELFRSGCSAVDPPFQCAPALPLRIIGTMGAHFSSLFLRGLTMLGNSSVSSWH